MFAKGSNIIPLSLIQTNATEDVIRAMVQNAVESNMNMLRVWVSGAWRRNVQQQHIQPAVGVGADSPASRGTAFAGAAAL